MWPKLQKLNTKIIYKTKRTTNLCFCFICCFIIYFCCKWTLKSFKDYHLLLENCCSLLKFYLFIYYYYFVLLFFISFFFWGKGVVILYKKKSFISPGIARSHLASVGHRPSHWLYADPILRGQVPDRSTVQWRKQTAVLWWCHRSWCDSCPIE